MKIFPVFLVVLIGLTLLVFVRLVLLRFRGGAPPVASAAPLPPERTSGPLEIKHHWFGAFEHRAGPPDPENFYEELTVEVGAQGSSATRTISVYVATPSALANAVDEYAFHRNLIVVPRYDMQVILRAVREQLGELL